jgi:hypothetical protein
MERARWTYTGRIDCFEIDATDRDALFQRTAEEVWSAGGEIQIAKADDQWDTDRYDVLIAVPGTTRPVVAMLHCASGLLGSAHEPWKLEGYDHENLQREDLLIVRGEVSRVPYAFQPEPSEVLVPDLELLVD